MVPSLPLPRFLQAPGLSVPTHTHTPRVTEPCFRLSVHTQAPGALTSRLRLRAPSPRQRPASSAARAPLATPSLRCAGSFVPRRGSPEKEPAVEAMRSSHRPPHHRNPREASLQTPPPAMSCLIKQVSTRVTWREFRDQQKRSYVQQHGSAHHLSHKAKSTSYFLPDHPPSPQVLERDTLQLNYFICLTTRHHDFIATFLSGVSLEKGCWTHIVMYCLQIIR